MKLIKKLILLGFLIFAAYMAWLIPQVIVAIQMTKEATEQDLGEPSAESIFKIRLDECSKYNLFQQATSKIGKRRYSENYNCLDFVKDLQQELRKFDIESSIFINKDRSHAWLGVWLEATNGQFIGPDSGYEIMEVRDNEMNVILKASWYDYDLPGYPGYSKDHRTCASRIYPRGTILRVIYQDRFTTCQVNDYGPEEWTGRDIDLSSLAFRDLAPLSVGVLSLKILQ